MMSKVGEMLMICGRIFAREFLENSPRVSREFLENSREFLESFPRIPREFPEVFQPVGGW
ncbi:hypothetical protein LCGC14_1242480 [marine sediment metagenome]|uniref:Uncharacterized protein n=1 Tax=marine sediment metagenome TaxID=412755 RepID=A0A0F9NMK1_9ZZZZ